MSGSKKNLTIAHIISALGRGGMEFAVSRLAVQQKKDGLDVHVICIRDLGPTAEMLKKHDIPVHLSPFRSRLHPASLKELKMLLRRIGASVVQTHNYRPNVSGTVAAKMAGIPAVISSLRTVNRWDTLRQYLMDRFICRWRDAIVCVSQEVRDRYHEKIKCPRSKLHVIHNGVDMDCLEPASPLKNLYEQYHLDPGDLHVISIARLVKIKDHPTLLRAFKKVVDRIPRAKLLILGEGGKRNELESLAGELNITDRVLFAGHQGNTRDWLSISDVSALSTHVEGFSSTILESLATGAPVVATDVGGNREAVEQGVTGFLTPHEDADEMADKIILLLEHPELRKKMGKAGRQIVENEFTIEATARKTYDLYCEILNRKEMGG